jgi:transcription initiation factor TFIIB
MYALRQQARTLAEDSERAGVTSGVRPAGFAAACIYKAGCEHGRRLIKTEVAGAANVSAATLRTYREMLDDLVA